jgi:hypothetical protein
MKMSISDAFELLADEILELQDRVEALEKEREASRPPKSPPLATKDSREEDLSLVRFQLQDEGIDVP